MILPFEGFAEKAFGSSIYARFTAFATALLL